VALGRQGHFDEARSHFERALAIDPQLAEAHAGLDLLDRIGERRSPPPEASARE
jgi:Flp pilus assembly protein TadD